jgi:EmrB/QacA subfamily drug resistance transporter
VEILSEKENITCADESRHRPAILLVTTLASFLTPFMGSAINIALPAINLEFSVDAVQLAWLITSYGLSSAVFLVPFGKLADIYGRKRIFLIGLVLFTVASLLSAVANSFVLFIVFRVLQGAGGAMLLATAVAILTSSCSPGERGKFLGINTAAVYLGLSLGPSLGGILTQYFGWRSIFLLMVPLGIITIAIVLWRLKGEWAHARGERFDYIGSIIYALALVALIYGLALLPEILGGILVLASVVGLIAFVFWERRETSPVLNLNLFRANTVFTFSNLAALVNYCATAAVGFLLSLYLQYVQGFDAQVAGLILISQPVIMAVFSPLAGRLSDRIEPRIVASVGMVISTAGLAFLILLEAGTSLWLVIAGLVFLGFGFALFSSPNTNAVMSSVGKRDYGVASATLGTMRLTGQMLSMGITMMIFSLVIGRVKIDAGNYLGFLQSERIALGIFTVLCFGGIFASLARGRVRG